MIDAPSPSRADLALPTVKGVLSQLGQLPDATNVAYKDNFRKVFTTLLFKTEVFKKRTPQANALAMDFQLYLLKKRYFELVDYCLYYIYTIHICMGMHGPSRRVDAHVLSNDVESTGRGLTWLHGLRSQ